jgi:hypothetical protein
LVVPLFALDCLLALIRVCHAAQPEHSGAPAAENAALTETPSAPATASRTDETYFPAPTRIRLVAGPWTRLTLLGSSDFAVLAGGGGGKGKQAGIDSGYLRAPTLEFGFRMGN